MTASQPFSLELTIQESSGLLGRIGRQTMTGRFCMMHAPGSSLSDAVVTIVAKDLESGDWRSYERSLTSEEALEVASQVDALGMPARTPDVSPVVCTSKSWLNHAFRVRKDDRANSFEIWMQFSGMEGPDADALRKLLQTLYSLSGYHSVDRSVSGGELRDD